MTTIYINPCCIHLTKYNKVIVIGNRFICVPKIYENTLNTHIIIIMLI